jgi:hypothetical protein
MNMQEEYIFSTYEDTGGTLVLYIWTCRRNTCALHMNIRRNICSLHMNIRRNICSTYEHYRNICFLHMNI